ncbi:helix-turn-helix transcriptional regulator [Marinomonas colpomeniae]|uniref:Helix-turn-helix transcriptional regulator n=1 Tax=Marinomonas colpomeniae TaxID=2774408 RepID=A0ABR8NWD3_9GAMM|nr:helix-turn-helix transcriptional regulator [Marinomonas colpomeniae]MBD5770371.1 helix-turn-helix transcriptional regulator [Marinomonas colpomeniae]
MANAIQINHMYGLHNQRLRNVTVHSPSIFWVQSGHKQLFWQDNELTLDSSNLLLTRAQQQLTFENKPERARFSSLQFSFNLAPTKEMLELSTTMKCDFYFPVHHSSKSLLKTLEIFSDLPWDDISRKVQTFWLNGFYQQLAEEGKLHQLFSSHSLSFSQKISEYLTQEPGQDYQLNDVAEHFSMSRATLIRRLKNEKTQFREVLTQVRMNHALSLMQKGHNQQIDIALRCGYQSQERFSQRFSQRFGVSPKQYLRTLVE